MTFSSFTVSIIICVLCLLIYLYKYITRNRDYFKDKPFPALKPTFLFGNSFSTFTGKISLFDYVTQIYNTFPNAKFIGMFDLTVPLTVVCNPESIKKICVKDFDYFSDHAPMGPIDDPGDSLFSNSLFMLRGQKWRDMRANLSPAFTGSKMRQMFELISVCAQNVTKHFIEETKSKGLQILEMKDTFSRFANDVIATTAFGLDIDSFHDKDNEFYYLGKNVFNFNSPTLLIRFIIMRIAPRLARKYRIDFTDTKLTDHFKTIMLQTFENRENSHIVRPDIVNTLLLLRKGQQIKYQFEEKEEGGFAIVEESDVGKRFVTRKWTDNELIAQSFLFFMAGFESVSTAMTFLSYELATNPEVQQRLYEEIKDTNENLDGKPVSYDVVQKLVYLDMVISESLRLWAPAPVVDRYCLKDYTYEDEDGMKFNIEKGRTIWLPIAAIHRDPQYYPNPDKFDPERFSPENRQSINLGAYIPFGVGPRNCIGSRFALMEIKILMYYLLLNFSFEVTEKTQVPLVLAKSMGSLTTEKGLYLEFKPRIES